MARCGSASRGTVLRLFLLVALLAATAEGKSKTKTKSKTPRQPKTNDERAKWRVHSKKHHLLGGGSEDAHGHNLKMQEQRGATPMEELNETPSWDTFYQDYVRANRPVVIRGNARMQPAFNLWSDEYLLERWSQTMVRAELWKSEERNGPTREMKFRDFVKKIHDESNLERYYAIIPLDDDSAARADCMLPEPIRCEEVQPQSLTLWMSSGGTSSVLHEDDAENFLMLLAGRKEVMLIHQDQAQHHYATASKVLGASPVHQDGVDHVRYPSFANVRWLSATLEAGDTLYIPHTFWHQVNSMGRNLAINVWWGRPEDSIWWNPSNASEYSPTKYGAPGFPSFQALKSRASASLPCTPLPEGQAMDKSQFYDENIVKKNIAAARKKIHTEL
eukprot:NODE_8686_length_1476_cov_7.763529.p1 GENE.NODE_8686_length_1476_cov_7.763529~~NODE_8686_length_1476_cov_7.763529.p1  ORF type:complete len:389 (+),score=106.90 NODE_8686_length_1476_cov_7.763529:40-1206(+)